MMNATQYYRISQILQQFNFVEVAILFGSIVNGRENCSSDLDIAVAAKRPISTEEKINLIDTLALEFGRPVDLVDMNQTVGLILQQILTSGIILINRNPLLYARLILKMLYDQADMMPVRNMIARKRLEAFAHG